MRSATWPRDGTVRRNQRRAAREALERVANVTGAIVVPAEQADGVRGCVRVLPPPDHKAAHDAAGRTVAREAPPRPNHGYTPCP